MNLAAFRQRVLASLPEDAQPPARRAWAWTRDVAGAVRARRPLVSAERVVWLRSEVADLERFRLLAPGPNEVLLRVHASLISPGTERALLLGQPNASLSFPVFPGYSAAGAVEAVGENVASWRPGERVAGVAPHASQAVVDPSALVRIPDGVSDEEAAFVSLGVIALQGVRRARLRPGEHVAILGLGLVGQLALRVSRWAGAGPLLAVARSARGFELARAGGADDCLALTSGSDTLRDLAADVVLEASGNPDAVLTAMESVRPGGRVVLLGSARGLTIGVNLQAQVAARGIQLIGAHVSSVAAQESGLERWTRRDEGDLFMELIARGRVRVEDLVGRRASPSEANAVYGDLAGDQGAGPGILFAWRSRAAAVPDAASSAEVRSRTDRAAVRRATAEATGRRLGIGFVGCGEVSNRNATGLAGSFRCRLVRVMDVNEKAARDLGDRFGVPSTGELDALLGDPAVEAVVVAVPHYLHAEITVQAARAGKHVIVEKPLATTLDDADTMIAACREAGVTLSVLFSFRYEPHVQRARQLVQAGALGRIVGTQVSFAIEKPVAYWAMGYSERGAISDWRGSKAKSGGGVLIMNMSHTLDYLRYVTGLDVERVYAEVSTENSPVEVEDIVTMTVRYAGGGVGGLQACTLARGESRTEERIWGTHGTLHMEPSPGRVYTMRKIDGLRPGAWQAVRGLVPADRVSVYFDRFAAALQEGRAPEVTAEDGRVNLAVLLAAYASGAAGRAMEPRYGSLSVRTDRP